MSNFTQLASSAIVRILEMIKERSVFIGVAGGSASGKTTFSHWLIDHLASVDCGLILQDSYYKDLSGKFDGDGGSVNFDHPSAIDFALLLQHLKELKQRRTVQLPTYDFKTHKRTPVTETMPPKRVVIVDGILVLNDPGLKEFFDLSFFISTPEEVRFARRLKRDVVERGRTEEGVRKQFALQVKPMHDQFVEPSQHAADYVLSGEIKFDKELFQSIRPYIQKVEPSLLNA